MFCSIYLLIILGHNLIIEKNIGDKIPGSAARARHGLSHPTNFLFKPESATGYILMIRENMLHTHNGLGILTADLSTGLGKGSILIIGGFGRFSTSTTDILYHISIS